MKCWAPAIALLSLALVTGASASELQGKVVRVADGDTISLQTSAGDVVRVRLSEIDAPERGQPYNQVARRSLVDLCGGQQARVEWAGKDGYGRTLGRVHCNQVDANAEQVRRGLAWAFTRYLSDPAIAELETTARSDRVGLWRDAEPVAPWDFRAAKRLAAVSR